MWIYISVPGASLGDSFGTVRERRFSASEIGDWENSRVRLSTFRFSFTDESRSSERRRRRSKKVVMEVISILLRSMRGEGKE